MTCAGRFAYNTGEVMYPIDAMMRLMTHFNIGAILAALAWLAMTAQPLGMVSNADSCNAPSPQVSTGGGLR